MRRAVAAGATALVLLAGCSSGDGDGDDEGSAADPSPSSGSTGPSDSGSSSPSPSSEASTAAPEPGAPAATGPVHTTSLFTVRGATRDYVSRQVSGDRITSLSDLAAGDNVYFSIRPDYADYTLEDVAADLERSRTYLGDLARQPDTEVAGEPAVHLSGTMSRTRHAEVYLILHEGFLVEIDFEMLTDPPARQRTVDSMLATFAWR
ncbi:hypothetical protein [Nocardioides lijunqiniae]|uniref:hypothetical protein n=1 Tax=Nocardioides lijunqiniae TaxID=2760832 RepID=UPI001878AD0B|nr:hypothetical protein [Nocardioides lijunqiniae]